MLIIVKVNQFRLKVPVGFYQEEREIRTEVLIDIQIRYKRENIQDDLNKNGFHFDVEIHSAKNAA